MIKNSAVIRERSRERLNNRMLCNEYHHKEGGERKKRKKKKVTSI